MRETTTQLDPASDALTLPQGPPTTLRIEVERARRKVYVPSRTPRVRRMTLLVLLALDIVVGWGALWGLPYMDWQRPQYDLVGWILLATACAACYVAGGYRVDRKAKAFPWGAIGAIGGMALGWILLKFVGTKLGLRQLRPPAAEGMIGATALIAGWVLLSRVVLGRLLQRVEARARILVIAPLAQAEQIRAWLRERGQPNPCCHFDPEYEVADDEAAPSDGTIESDARLPLSALDAHAQGAVKTIVLGLPAEALSTDTLADLIHCRVLGVPVVSPSQLVEELWERVPVEGQDHGWYLHDELGHRSIVYAGLKRLLDVVGSLLGLIVASPLLLLAGLAIRVTSRGPVLLRQTRVGRWKKRFKLYKLRTMRVDAEAHGARWTAPDDPRISRLGRLLRRSHCDELPQLWNVLLGQMSLVGPRPERPAFTVRLEEQIPWYDLRHLVKPGITGWAQVSHRYGASVNEAVTKLEYDIYYIKHASIRFDVRILARTVPVVLGLQGR